jgi:hypothetical protein
MIRITPGWHRFSCLLYATMIVLDWIDLEWASFMGPPQMSMQN